MSEQHVSPFPSFDAFLSEMAPEVAATSEAFEAMHRAKAAMHERAREATTPLAVDAVAWFRGQSFVGPR